MDRKCYKFAYPKNKTFRNSMLKINTLKSTTISENKHPKIHHNPYYVKNFYTDTLYSSYNIRNFLYSMKWFLLSIQIHNSC